MSHNSAMAATASHLPLRINIVKMTFWVVFVLLFMLSGVLTIATNYVYRMGLMSLLVLPLLLLYGVRLNWVVLGYAALTLTIFASALKNGSSLIDIVEFSRTLVFSFLIYYLVSRYVTGQRLRTIFKVCIYVGWIQLPVLLMQRLSFDYLPAQWKRFVTITDYDFGTFNYKGDYEMVFFLNLFVILLLFENRRLRILRNRWPTILWFSLTIMVANAQILKLVLIASFLCFFLLRFRLKNILYGIGAFVIGVGLFIGFERTGWVNQDITVLIGRARDITTIGSDTDADVYLGGGYDRAGAITYLLTEDGSWLGDGPAKYQNPVSREVARGNMGHFFTFVSEVGWLGWLQSVLIFALIAFPIRGSTMRFSAARLLAFIAINILSFTSQAMNDVAVILSYCLFCQYHLLLIPPAVRGNYAATSAPLKGQQLG